MTRRKRTSMIVVVAVAALLVIAGVAYAAGVFPDVAAGDTHTAAIEWAAANGIVNGYTNENFGPYDTIKRGQAATMFKNYDDYLKSTASGDSTCSDCHNDTSLLTSKKFQWSASVHGIGFTVADHWESGVVDAGCAGCHSGNGFSKMVAADQVPNQVTEDDVMPTPQDCRTCHQVHETYTGADWALETDAPVDYYALPGLVGKTFDGGAGNLCAVCHQPRVDFPAAVAGNVEVTSSRFGPHHGPQSAMIQGVAGAGAPDSAGMHYTLVADTCVTCHMGANSNHTFEPSLDNCTACHGADTDALQTKIDELQAEVQALGDALNAKLLAAGMITATGAAVPGDYAEAKAAALWDYRTIMIEDKSVGVHNPSYAKALLNAGIAAFN